MVDSMTINRGESNISTQELEPDEDRCWSYLGRTNGRQPISLAKNKCMAKGIVQHEVLHALGFHHEQNRSDRDSYVNILYQNIKPAFRDQFTKVDTNNLGTLYDFDSIMHYSNTAFSRNKKPTIISKIFPGRRFGTANEMNSFDIARVNALYGCCSSQN
nr:high choriolytic enzyme 1-like [Nerophis lumbriciformis]